MSSLQNMLNYLDEKSLINLIEELENLFIEKSLTKILYTFLTIKKIRPLNPGNYYY